MAKSKPKKKKSKPKGKKAKTIRKESKPSLKNTTVRKATSVTVRARPEVIGLEDAPSVYADYVVVTRTQHDFALSFCLTEPYMDFDKDKYKKDKDGLLIIKASSEVNLRIPEKLVVSLVSALKSVYNISHPENPI